VDQYGYGFRAPTLIISPFARAGFIDHTVADHTSILKFIETLYGLKPLATRDAIAANLMEAFDFDQAPASPLILPGKYLANHYPLVPASDLKSAIRVGLGNRSSVPVASPGSRVAISGGTLVPSSTYYITMSTSQLRIGDEVLGTYRTSVTGALPNDANFSTPIRSSSYTNETGTLFYIHASSANAYVYGESVAIGRIVIQGNLTLGPSSVKSGDTLAIRAHGLVPHRLYSVVLVGQDSNVRKPGINLTVLASDAFGHVSKNISFPHSIPVGAYLAQLSRGGRALLMKPPSLYVYKPMARPNLNSVAQTVGPAERSSSVLQVTGISNALALSGFVGVFLDVKNVTGWRVASKSEFRIASRRSPAPATRGLV
jgi:hypothetical protein